MTGYKTKTKEFTVSRDKNVVTLKWWLPDEYEAMLFYDSLTKNLAAGRATVAITVTRNDRR